MKKIVITVTEHGLGYQGDLPDGVEVEVRDFRPETIRAHVQVGEQPICDDLGQCYIPIVFPIPELPF